MTEKIDILYTLLSSGVTFLVALFWILFVFFCRYVCRRYVCFKEPTPLSESEESQADVWSISLQEDITELPSYEESRKYPETIKPPPPGYLTNFPDRNYCDQPVITVTS